VVGRTEVAIGRLEPYKAMNFPLVVLRSGVANIGLEFTAAGSVLAAHYSEAFLKTRQ